MDVLLKVIACAFLTVIVYQTLTVQRKDIALLLSLAACCMIYIVAIEYLTPLVAFIDKLQQLGQLDTQMVKLILKAVGVGVITEIATLICKDVGNEAVGKALQILSVVTVLWMALPLFDNFLSLLDTVLGDV